MPSSRTLVGSSRRRARPDPGRGRIRRARPGSRPHAPRRRARARPPARRDRLLEARPGSRGRRRLLDAAEPLGAGPRRRARDRPWRASARASRRQGLSSAYCRTLETARLAFGRATVHPALLNTIAAEHDAAWRKQIRDARRLLGTMPAAGEADRPRHARRRRPGDDGQTLEEGEAIVFRPLGNSRFRRRRPRHAAGVGDAAAPGLDLRGRHCACRSTPCPRARTRTTSRPRPTGRSGTRPRRRASSAGSTRRPGRRRRSRSGTGRRRTA